MTTFKKILYFVILPLFILFAFNVYDSESSTVTTFVLGFVAVSIGVWGLSDLLFWLLNPGLLKSNR